MTKLDPAVEEAASAWHDKWCERMFSEGWSYGEVEDSVAKTDPRLVPYKKLTAEQKEAVRSAAAEGPVGEEPAAEKPAADAEDEYAAAAKAGTPKVALVGKYSDRIPVQLKSKAHLDQLMREHVGNVEVQDAPTVAGASAEQGFPAGPHLDAPAADHQVKS